jgi:hypothetical protein
VNAKTFMGSSMRWSSRVAAMAGMVAVVMLVLALSSSRADAFCQGTSCLPGSGYTQDTTWNCGVLGTSATCYANGATIIGNAVLHTWGWGSAAYNGAGNVGVCLNAVNSAGTQAFWGDCGTNLARASALDQPCNDQDSTNYKLGVFLQGSNPHTIHGHGKY